MAYPRCDKFDDSQESLADTARALSHPARLAILEVLASRNECICGDLVHELPLAQATVSQHLKVLKEAGLIDGNMIGARTCYCINEKLLDRAVSEFVAWFDRIQNRKTCC